MDLLDLLTVQFKGLDLWEVLTQSMPKYKQLQAARKLKVDVNVEETH
jgi:hypothetical protein